MKRIIILLSVVLAVSGCYLADTLNFINTPAEISLTWRGEPQVTYESQSYQMGFNDHKNEYRIYEDRLANWFTIRCSEKPVEDEQILTADVTWTGRRSTKTFEGISFTVKKTDENGYVWLWNDSDKIGIIIKHI